MKILLKLGVREGRRAAHLRKGGKTGLETALSITRVTTYYNFSNTANYHHAINVNTKADKTGFAVIV